MTEEMNNNGFGGGYKALSVIGTVLGGLGVLGEGTSLLGMTGNKPDYVTKETLDMSMQISRLESDKALLSAELNTEKKMVEVFNALNDKINTKVAEQSAINQAQAVTNCAVTSTLAVAQNNISQLMALTKTVVPADNICPKPMPEFNSWTAPT